MLLKLAFLEGWVNILSPDLLSHDSRGNASRNDLLKLHTFQQFNWLLNFEYTWEQTIAILNQSETYCGILSLGPV